MPLLLSGKFGQVQNFVSDLKDLETPIAEFSASVVSGAAPLTVFFENTSTNFPNQYEWDFTNNGSTDSTTKNGQYTYDAVGTYSVKLTVSNETGSNSITKTNYITVTQPAPQANFTANVTNGILPLTINFTDTSTNNPTSWAWDFKNDGTATSSQQNPSYTYTTTGTYSVKLTVTNASGSNTVVRENYITVNIATPLADFTASPTTGNYPLTVQFTDTSTNNPTSWAWDFKNDGTATSSQQNPSYTYTTAGTYTVKLTSTNISGSNSVTKANYITVNIPAPIADFIGTPTTGVVPLTVNFTDTSANNPTSWLWDFKNDGTATSTQQNPSYIYQDAGSYTIKLTSTNISGSNIVTKTNYVTAQSAFVGIFEGTDLTEQLPLVIAGDSITVFKGNNISQEVPISFDNAIVTVFSSDNVTKEVPINFDGPA